MTGSEDAASFLGCRTRDAWSVVNILALVSAGCVAFDFATSAVPEVVPFGAETSGLFYDLGLAYLTAWAFHRLVIVAPERTRARRLHRTIAPRVDALIRLGFDISEGLCKAASTSPAFPPPPTTVADALNASKPDDEFPGWASNWLIVLSHLLRQAEGARVGLKPFYTFLESDLLEVLVEEEQKAESLTFVIKATGTLPRNHLRDLAKPLEGWLASIAVLLDMRNQGLAPAIDAPAFCPRDVVRIPIERWEEDFLNAVITSESDH
jgi:hypothetical protein